MRSGKYYKKLTLADGTVKDEHRLLLEKKVGRKLSFNEISHHEDEDINNNHPDNLKLMSRSDHSRLHASKRVYGTGHSEKMQAIGIQTMPNKKLTEAQVIDIRAKYAQSVSAKDLMKSFKISKRTVYDIVSKTTWKHI